jgi:Calcineurin-like phosphoesterase
MDLGRIAANATLLLIVSCCAGLHPAACGQEPILKFVSVPDFINMDMQALDPRLFDLTNARQAELVSEIAASGPQASINPHVGNFVGTVENGYRGASQVLLEALAAENADFFTVSGDMLYTRWPKNSQLTDPGAPQHIRDQADIYYDAWADMVTSYGGFGLADVYTIVGDHEIGDNDWGSNKRPLIPAYKEVYVDKLGNESTTAGGAYVNAPAGFEGRTFAVQRGNMLLIGVDQFETFDAAGNFNQAAGQIASVRIDVTGTQLQWLDDTLTQASSDPTIDHVVAMAHAPIAGQTGVKIGHSSGLLNATPETGALWQTLAEHDVDLYLPGEVHDISMQLAEDVLQVVTGTNIFQPSDQPGDNSIGFNLASPLTSEQNYMVVEVYQDRIDLTIKQIETKLWGSQGLANDPVNDAPYKNREARVAAATAAAGFQTVGTLTIDKSSGSPVYRNRSGLFITEWTIGAPLNVDLNNDHMIDALDAQQFLSGLHTDLSGLTPEQALAMGDLNGDLKNNFADFRLFKSAYDTNNGAGAFDAALAFVPEPSSAAILVAITTMWSLGRFRLSGRAQK